MSRYGICIALVLATTVLVGCGSESEPKSESPTAKSGSKGSQYTDVEIKTAPRLDQAKGVSKDVKLTKCTLDGTDVQASGTLVNSKNDALDFVMTVSWINKATDVQTQAFAVERDVPAGEKRTWNVTATQPKSANSKSCTLLAESGTLAE